MKKWLCALAVFSANAFSQDYPNKPVRMVLGFPAGGISDVLGRAIAIPLSKQLGQPVVVENKPGAGTTIAGDFIVKSAPDGYTLWLQDITTHAINTNLYSKLPYDSMKDFSFVAMVASTPLHRTTAIEPRYAAAQPQEGCAPATGHSLRHQENRLGERARLASARSFRSGKPLPCR